MSPRSIQDNKTVHISVK